MDYAVLGEQLKNLRTERRLKQKELSDQIYRKTGIYISAANISDIENIDKNGKIPGCDKIYAIAVFFGVTTDSLLSRERASAPDDLIQEIYTCYGLNEKSLKFLEYLNASTDIDRDEVRKIMKKILIKNEDSTKCEPTKEDFELLNEGRKHESKWNALIALNDLLSVTTENGCETYGYHIFNSIYDYCRRSYKDEILVNRSETGISDKMLTPDDQRNIDILKIKDALSYLRDKIEKEKKTNGNNTKKR